MKPLTFILFLSFHLLTNQAVAMDNHPQDQESSSSSSSSINPSFEELITTTSICPICRCKLVELEKKGDFLSITTCGHVFCAECINKWQKKHNTCPTCNKDFEDGEIWIAPYTLAQNVLNRANITTTHQIVSKLHTVFKKILTMQEKITKLHAIQRRRITLLETRIQQQHPTQRNNQMRVMHVLRQVQDDPTPTKIVLLVIFLAVAANCPTHILTFLVASVFDSVLEGFLPNANGFAFSLPYSISFCAIKKAFKNILPLWMINGYFPSINSFGMRLLDVFNISASLFCGLSLFGNATNSREKMKALLVCGLLFAISAIPFME